MSDTAPSIAAMMQSSGSTVRGVLLRHMQPSGRDVHPHVAVVLDGDSKPSSVDGDAEGHHPKHREILTELIQELNIDTTPGKNGVHDILGGNFTFIGQYPEEGIILMARVDQFADLEDVEALSVRELKEIIQDNPDIDINPATLLDKSDLVQAVKDSLLPINPHVLQPPFDDCTIRGDILLMKVADIADESDDEDDPSATLNNALNDFTKTTAIPNDEFFLDYTKDEYIAFASRTDVVAPPVEDEEEDEDYVEGDEENNDDDDDEFNVDAVDDEEDKRVLLNLILGEVIKSFRHENGRGPDGEELLELRSQVAEKLNLSLPPRAPPVDGKRNADEMDPQSPSPSKKISGEGPSPKRVKFTPEIISKAEQSENGLHDENGEANDDIVDSTVDCDRKTAATEMQEGHEKVEVEDHQVSQR